MKILSDRRARIAIAAGALFIVLLLFILSAFRRNEIRTHENAEIAQGIAYLEALETTGVRGVQEAIRANETEQIREKLDDLLAKIESGEADIWSYFSDAVILGDSRADDFQYNGFLPKYRIMAELGTACVDAEDYLDTIMDLYPAQVYFTYGMNDVDGYWNTPSDFHDAYAKVIREFMNELPDAEFFVCSIIPVNQHAIDNNPHYLQIPEYNEEIRKIADELGITWINCDDMLVGHEDLYDTDGQHFFPEAYPLWARYMLKARFEEESGLTTGDTDYESDGEFSAESEVSEVE